MCGIFFFRGKIHFDLFSKCLKSLKHRGPDQEETLSIGDSHFGFQRLAIIGLDRESMQPFQLENCILICNGEIYNYKELIKKYHLTCETNSDCEVIIHLYKLLGIEATLSQLEGEFAFVLKDLDNDLEIAARDHVGIRPLFFGISSDGSYGYASELKALHPCCDVLDQFPICSYQVNGSITKKYKVETSEGTIKELLIASVKRRLQSDRNIGFFLSGGLDSSLICAIAARELGVIDTFSVGIKGSPDLIAARKVADYLHTNHTEIYFTPEQGITHLKDLIYHLETYDTTTIRASLPMYLLSKYIKEQGIAVVLSGEGSDELFAGYLYSHYAPSGEELQKDLERLVSQLHRSDLVRGDRAPAAHSLEVRLAFLDASVVKAVMELPIEKKNPKNNNGIEKFYLRDQFRGWLPYEILWRTKEAFSDGCGYDLVTSLRSFGESQVTDFEFEARDTTYPYLTPRTKEEYHYRTIFDGLYPSREHVLKEYWMPKWTKVIDPSARVLDVHPDGIRSD